MRLLTYDGRGNLKVTSDLANDDVPPYAILSHTWGSDDKEVKFNEIESEECRSKAGYKKIEFCGQQAQQDGLQYFWVDTCCIDKTNSTELSEAITSMYRWYQNAKVCYVYLADVASSQNDCDAVTHDVSPRRSWKLSFRKSRWFTRGWTLQELLAPRQVVFYSKECERLGTKQTLRDLLHEITNISVTALENQPLSRFTVAERLCWIKGRTTKKKEDEAYCLQGIFNVYLPLIYGEGDHAFVRLMEAINKVPKRPVSLQVVDCAVFDAYSQVHQGCHPATRVELLRSIWDWTRNIEGKSIFWLNGGAGTGKSTISWTVAKGLADLGTSDTIALGASFFFKRGEGNRASAALFFPTIASQMAANINNFDVFLEQAVKADPRICQKSLGQQFSKLISEPLERLRPSMANTTYILVVDALDECEDERDVYTILKLWSTLSVTYLARLRLFLTSRPELAIRLSFKKISTTLHHDLILHEIPRSIVQHDILVFLTDMLRKVRKDYNLLLADDPVNEQLGQDWPGSRALQELTHMATPLFIVAATICRLVRKASHPQSRLEGILRSKKQGRMSETQSIYLLVLQTMTRSFEDEDEADVPRLHSEFRSIVGVIITLAEPLSRTALAVLLDMKSGDVQIQLRSLHSVLEVPQDKDAPIRPLHLSFTEYLTDQGLHDTPYWIDQEAVHAFLWTRCLRLLSGSDGLRENICHLEYPGQSLSERPHKQVEDFIPLEVRYSCHYWIHHVQQSRQQIEDDSEVHVFLKIHMLHWLEAMSLMNLISEAVKLLDALKSCVLTSASELSALIEDARRFVLANRYVIDRAPLQLYSSAIIFAPERSLVRKLYDQVPLWITRYPRTPDRWSCELQRLEGHSGSVRSVTFSSDGTLLVSRANEVRLWDVYTGSEVQTLESLCRDDCANTISPDDTLLASGSWDQTVRLWDVRTGNEVQKLEGHSDGVYAVAFSPDGTLLASGSWDQTVRLWNVRTGNEVQKLEGHSEDVYAVAFSPDGTLLASVSNDKTIRLWDVRTGNEVQKLKGHPGQVNTVKFSPNGALLAFGSCDHTVRLWDVRTGNEVQKLKGHSGQVNTVTFSPNGALLAFGSESQLICIWDVHACSEVRKLEGHSDIVCAVAFSPDGTLLASGSWDQTVRLWDVRTGNEVQKLEGHSSFVNIVKISPNGALLASGSEDQTVRLWDIQVSRDTRSSYVSATTSCQGGIFLASNHINKDADIRGTQSGRELQKLEVHSGKVWAITLSPNGTLLASGSADRTIRLWDILTGQEVRKLKGHTDRVFAIAFSPDSTLLASGSWDQTVRLWDVRTGNEVQKLEGHSSYVYTVAFSHNSALLASGSADRTIRLWDVLTGQEVRKLKGHTDRVFATAFSPDSTLLASGSRDQTVRLWDVLTGQEVQRLEGHTKSVCAIAFSPDSTLLASGSCASYATTSLMASASDSQAIWLWEAQTGRVVEVLEELPSICTIRFIDDSSALITDKGTFDICNNTSSNTRTLSPTRLGTLSACYDWIQVDGRNVLWLPHEYRGLSAAHGDKLAIAGGSAVHIFHFDYRYLATGKARRNWPRHHIRRQKPRRCSRCHWFGHAVAECDEEEEICAKCSDSGHTATACTNEWVQCAVCDGCHETFDDTCAVFQQEKERYRSYYE